MLITISRYFATFGDYRIEIGGDIEASLVAGYCYKYSMRWGVVCLQNKMK